MARRLILYLLALGTVTFWGASFPLTKMALDWTGPMNIAFLRWMISAIVLAGWLAVSGKFGVAGAALRRDWRTLIWVALTGVTLFYALENLSLGYTTATNAGILSNLTSVFIALLGTWWLHEQVPLAGWLAMLAAFAGAVLVSQGAGHLTFSGTALIGDLMMVVACFFAAIYSIGGKKLAGRYPADVVTMLVASIGAAFLLPMALQEGLSLALPTAAWVALLALGLGAGALANLWWIYILARTRAARAGTALFLIPVISTVLSVTTLHEPLTLTMVIGGAIVLTSVAVAQQYSN